ncbi:Ig-like domain-containing protein, partial [Pseudoalteromonas sp. C8]|uniref:Ig-like domain-containing protein n=1 Tax=Pseudoalteromonas sp. C8 TaxID=2686345 RepID=UPI003216F7A2
MTANDAAGHTDSATTTINIDTTVPDVTVDDLTTNDSTPVFTGTIDDPTAVVTVTIAGTAYTAVNNTNGTWTLDDSTIPALSEGILDISVSAADAAGNTDDATGTITIDLTGLNVGIDDLTTNSLSPELTGSIDDPEATVIVTIGDNDYNATNNGDTWTLAADTLTGLVEG